jgi:DNA modification methylase
MQGRPLPGDLGGDLVVTAIGRAGFTGITAKQLSAVTQLPEAQVARKLGCLLDNKEVSRIGRGLWVLREFAVVEASNQSFKGAAWYDREFERDFNLRICRQKREIQFNPNEKLVAHRWWPYVQGFSAGFVADICRRFGVGRGSVVIDPFCGSGTVPITARLLGAKGVGIDMMPIAAFVARAKGEWSVDPKSLQAAATGVTLDRSPSTLAKPFLTETDRHFQPDVLASLLRLKENIWNLPEGRERELLQLGFGSILIDCSNLKRSPCLGYSKKLGLSSETPFEEFLRATRCIEKDLAWLQVRTPKWGPPVEIHLGSSASVKLPPSSIDLAITSPPYVNGMDYPTNYKIDLAWLDFVHSYDELASLRAAMVACDNIPRDTALSFSPPVEVKQDEWVRTVVNSIERNIETKGAYRRHDMGQIVTKYFGDLVPVMQNVLRALKPGGRFVVVNGDSLLAGTYIPGDMIFARLAASIGFIVEGFDIARERRSGQRRGFVLRESWTTLRKPGPLVPPNDGGGLHGLDAYGAPN